MTTRAEFVATVRGYLNTPFHLQGRVPGVGLDCPGVVLCACWHHGLKPLAYDVRGYGNVPTGTTMQAICDEQMDRIDFVQAQPGDVIVVQFQRGYQHLGVLTDANPLRRYWVHAEAYRHKCVIEGRLLFDRATALVAAYRVPGLV